jgi:RecF/RecN/SMC N terminal domain
MMTSSASKKGCLMRLKSVSIKDFKRFTDLRIQALPESAKLIVLCGPNGTGKSSFFDALKVFQASLGAVATYSHDVTYYYKSSGPLGQAQQYQSGVLPEFYEDLPTEDSARKKMFYLRTAFRNDPEFLLSGLPNVGSALDEKRPARTIENDTSVLNNYVRLIAASIESLFAVTGEEGVSAYQLRESIIGEVRNALRGIYPELTLTGLGRPLAEGSTFYFTKGLSEDFPYKNLSAGEKAVFDLVLDLIMKRKIFDDTIWCIDEPEAHLNSRIQGQLLRVLVDLVPENSQLILATHSIGFMKEAWQLSKEAAGSVAFLDFQDQDFDQPVVLEPVQVTRDFWRRTLDVAMGDLASLVSPEEIVICEGRPVGDKPSKNTAFDAKCYRQIFEKEYPNVEFVSVGSSRDVTEDKVNLGQSIQMLTPGVKITRVTDRDLMNDDEVAAVEQQGVRVLSRRNIEAYLLDDEVLTALCASVDQADKASTLIATRDRLMTEAQTGGGADPDDLKKVAGTLYVEARRLLSLTRAGSTWPAFASSTLAPLITPGSRVYCELRRDIFNSRDT